MTDLTQSQFDELPEFIKTDYQQDGEVFRHSSEFKAAKLKSSLNDLDFKLKETNNKLSDYEKGQAERQSAAEKKALDKLMAEGKTKEILEDVERRNNETKAQYEARIEKITQAYKQDKINMTVAELSELATDKGKSAFKRLIKSRIDVDIENNKVTFLNDDGSASSLDLAGFKAELLADESYSPLLKANIPTHGGGNANGSSGGSAQAKTMKREAYNALPLQSQAEFIRSGGRLN